MRIVEIRLTEISPQSGQACTTVDSANRFYSLIPEQLLIPGVVIPANCTVLRLLKYSCMENIQYGKRSYTKHRMGRMSDKTMAAEITIQTLVLCNACNLADSSSQSGYKSDFDPFIDQQQIATIISNSGIDFSVQAFEVKEEKRRTRSRKRGPKKGSKGGRTRTRKNSKPVFCNGRILSYATSSSMQCGK